MVTAKQILTYMYQFRGVGAKSKVKQTYNDYASKNGLSKTSDSAWCSETVSATFIKANATWLIGGIAKDSGSHVKHFKKLGIWKQGHSRIPSPGDIAIFQDSKGNPNHTEMVYSVNEKKGTFTAVSGNYLGNVGTRTRKIHGSNIHGYGCPNYDSYNIVSPAIVKAVLSGKYGKGDKVGTARFDKLALAGYDPDEVQHKVNWVLTTASNIKNGKNSYGNAQDRKDALGKWYEVVQKQINVLYGIDSWSN